MPNGSNDGVLTLVPFWPALGYQTVVIARHEAIFNCFISLQATQKIERHAGCTQMKKK